MYLKKFIYVNWGNVPNTEFEFGPINLFSGGNGSGKTTAADAIQTVMTAAHDNLFHFNPGQDESSQRGRGGKLVRTLASYVLGCDDGAYARPQGCDGYLAAVFYPTQGENSEPFTALIGMRAFLETAGQGASLQKVARLDDTQFYILSDVALSLNDLLKEEKTHKYVVPLDKLYAGLRRQYGQQQVEKYDKKKTYLCRLYGILRGKKDAVSEREAMNAARAFSRFMAYKPIKGIDEFVANEILEYRDLGEAIRTVSTMLKRIHTMEADARTLRQGIERMAQGREQADKFIANWLEQQVLQYSLAKRRYSDSQKLYLEAKHKQQLLRETSAAHQQTLAACEAQRDEINQLILAATARRLGVPALRDKDQLEQEKHNQETLLQSLVPELRKQHQQMLVNLDAVQQFSDALRQTSIAVEVPLLKDAGLAALVKDVCAETESLDIHQLLNRDLIDVSPLEPQLKKVIAIQKNHNAFIANLFDVDTSAMRINLRDQLAQERDKRKTQTERLQKQTETKRREIQTLESHQVSYPGFVRAALDAIAAQCPKADARVLCDYVEVIDREWQAAIEGYIGAARFGIIVEPAYEAEAIAIVRNMAGQGNRARIIQGEKARKDLDKSGEVASNSIIHVMNFSHATAEAYIKASYGNVQRVDNAQELKNTRRGITKDAMGSGNYAMFRCDMADSELVFGQGARERALDAKRNEFHHQVSEWQAATKFAEEAQALLIALDKLKPLQYADVLQSMFATQNKIQAIDSKLQQLDLTDTKALESELEQLQIRLQTQNQEYARLNNAQVDCRAELKLADNLCQKLDIEQEKTLEQADICEANVQAIVAYWPEFDADARLLSADESVLMHGTAYYEAQLAGVNAELKTILHRLQQAAMVHNQFCSTSDSILVDLDYTDDLGSDNFRAICDMRRQFDALYNRDKNHILAQRHQEIESLRESFNNAFVTNLCHSIYQAINDGKKILEDLNKELEHHRFGADRESFRFDWEWVPEFKEYWQFFKAVIDSPSLDEGETLFNMKLDDKHQRVRERLMNMLLDEDEQKALRELTRIADYRNYRRYEIFKQPEGKAPIALSQYGTGSGGQLETPAYIIRSAAITSAFRFNEGNSHLRMVLVDEAFSKMDEHRSREVINYLTESLGLQLNFIMPSSKSGPFMDLISNQFVFSKCPTAEPVGELKTRVMLDRQVCDQEKIKKLMANHRRAIRQQAALDFMAEVEAG
ncbi:ATP-binding protein [Cellvibrio sp. pealriver]|uniref:ATP-binding protein n=1 Tax=Cellvibrio sp. pealriver TaxID=1622269 RepID=UPI00066FD7C2|nr:SbcC/MukB-like Walker B domain-containing protein [Cellvibrio sp. pealriver]